ncbi:MAG: tRNA (adenosine(37)-N6)-dimethylallyltransferase MiaA [Gemmatimonadetes bacterium]|nr:tRNA (adenosine(37)-N6)-dimethylallyltransferase MiaA [Gemmatimonadota bacterium]
MSRRPEEHAFLAIVGPTGAGKTALSLSVAQALGGEIVSMDSRQVYRGMDIGTAKVTLADRGRAPHHGLDLIDPDEIYSAGRFARDARVWIRDIRSRGRVPILVGGTGFFLRALTHPLFEEPPMDPGRRTRLQRLLEDMPVEELEEWAGALDPARSPVAKQGGRQRLVRACLLPLMTGRPLSWWHARSPGPAPLTGLVLVVAVPVEVLDRRIDERVSHMEREGLVAEVQALLHAGYGEDSPGLSAVGYREVVEHLTGRTTLQDAMERTRRATRQYARRQRTWFRRQLPSGALELDGTRPVGELTAQAVSAWRRSATA